jgi:hypothetical protein
MNPTVGAIELRYDAQMITAGKIVKFMESRSSFKSRDDLFSEAQLLQHTETHVGKILASLHYRPAGGITFRKKVRTVSRSSLPKS